MAGLLDCARSWLNKGEKARTGPFGAAESTRSPSELALKLAPIRDHLPGDDVGVDLERPVAVGADLDVMAAWRQPERLRRWRELSDRSDMLTVDVHVSRARRHLEGDAAHIRGVRTLDPNRSTLRIPRLGSGRRGVLRIPRCRIPGRRIRRRIRWWRVVRRRIRVACRGIRVPVWAVVRFVVPEIRRICDGKAPPETEPEAHSRPERVVGRIDPDRPHIAPMRRPDVVRHGAAPRRAVSISIRSSRVY